MSTQYCDVCGMYVESDCAGKVRTCGLELESSTEGDDYGYLNDCPFDNDLTIENYNEEMYEDLDDEYQDD